MAQNTTTATEAQIKTIVVDPDDIVEALRFNAQPPEYTNRRRAVIRVSPPFGETVNASVHYSEEGTYYPPGMSPKPLHINPGVFVEDRDDTRVPFRNDARARAREMLDDPAEEEVDEWVATEFEHWEEAVRMFPTDEADISGPEFGEEHSVTVEYED